MWLPDEEREFWRMQCQKSFWDFLVFCTGATKRFQRRPWVDEKVHRPMCEWFENHVNEWMTWRNTGIVKKKYLAILIPRQVGKTTIFTKAGLLWLHLKDPNISTYIGSENLDKAVDMLNGVKAIIDGTDDLSNFVWLYGNWYDSKRTWKTGEIVHAARTDMQRGDASIGTWGVEGGLTSKHPDVLCLDDPTSYEKMAGHTNWLTMVNNHIDSLAPVPTPDGLIMFVGTRYHDGDHFGRSFQSDGDGVKTVTGMPIPGVTPTKDGIWDVYYLAGRDAKGKPVIPSALPEDELKRLEKRNSLKYAAQYMNDPASSEYNPLTEAQVRLCIIRMEDVPKNLRFTMHCDTAFKSLEKQAKGDESVIQIWGHARDGSGDVYFIEGYSRNNWRAEQYAERIAVLIQKYKKSGKRIVMLTDEQVLGGKEGVQEALLRSFCHNAGLVLPPFKTLYRSSKSKLSRLVEAATYWADGHVKLPEEAPGLEKLIEQQSKIGSSAHDDWSDAAADVFHPLVYNVMKRVQDNPPEQDNSAARPMDDILKNLRRSPEDRWLHGAERWGYDIGNVI